MLYIQYTACNTHKRRKRIPYAAFTRAGKREESNPKAPIDYTKERYAYTVQPKAHLNVQIFSECIQRPDVSPDINPDGPIDGLTDR